MAITYFGAAASPADNGSQSDTTAHTITPPGSMVAGDLVYLAAQQRTTAATLSLSVTGGQSWTEITQFAVTSSGLGKIWWCRYNGTWAADPAVDSTVHTGTDPLSLQMLVFRPTSGTNTWAVDVAFTNNNFSAPVAPFDVTATGHTSIAASTVTVAAFFTVDDNTWALQSGGWTNPGGAAQYRNGVGIEDQSASFAYKIQTSAAATGNVTNRQLTLGGDAGRWGVLTLKEQGSGVTVSDAGDELYYDGETGITITGTTFEVAKGLGDVLIASADSIVDASAVSQPTTAWGDTSVTFTANLSTFAPFVPLYLFVKNNAGASNSSGRPVKREARFRINDDLDNGGAPWASQSNIQYRIVDATLNGTLLLSGSNETTDGSAILATSYYTLTEGGDLSAGDHVIISLFQDNATLANTRGTTIKYLPTYE